LKILLLSMLLASYKNSTLFLKSFNKFKILKLNKKFEHFYWTITFMNKHLHVHYKLRLIELLKAVNMNNYNIIWTIKGIFKLHFEN
jgi:hypothetical protein